MVNTRRSRFVTQNRCSGAAKILAIINGPYTGGDAKFQTRHLTLTALAANLAHRFEHVQHAAGRGRLAAIDHAAAGLDWQIAFERKVGPFEECLVVSAAEAEVFDLNHDDRDVVVVK